LSTAGETGEARIQGFDGNVEKKKKGSGNRNFRAWFPSQGVWQEKYRR